MNAFINHFFLAIVACAPPRGADRIAPPPKSVDKLIEDAINKIRVEEPIGNLYYSDSVYVLINFGMPAVPHLLDVILAGDKKEEVWRMRAQTALHGIVEVQCGFRFGEGWKDPEGAKRATLLLKKLGNLHWDDPIERRRVSVALWLDWYRQYIEDLKLK